jgi:Xaa-Pro dipeptidase
MLSRRGLFGAGALLAAAGGVVPAAAEPGLKSLTAGAAPISREERLARIAKAQKLMRAEGLKALLIEAGTSMDYFSGVQWWRSERTTALIIPAEGEVVVVTPHFEAPSVSETLAVPGEVMIWHEHESPFQRIVQALQKRGITSGAVGVEGTVRFFILDGVRKASSAYELRSGEAVVRGCRMIKSPAEIALMQAASDVTLAAIRWAHGRVAAGMTRDDIAALIDQASTALGGQSGFSLVLLNEASAYPHGSRQRQVVREGSTVLVDCGCTVHGYQSDISRTFVFGTPSAKQRRVWATVKRGQEVALEAAQLGTHAGHVDAAVRAFYEKEGWGPGYALPGLSHRVGHGIGMDGHEPAFFVGGDETPLQAGMCFSDEPGLYIPGEFGIRLEDCLYMTEHGPKLFTGLAKSLDEPV